MLPPLPERMRPHDLEGYVGQKHLVENLLISAEPAAVHQRLCVLDDILHLIAGD